MPTPLLVSLQESALPAGLAAAVSALGRLGYTPEAFERASDEERRSDLWCEVLQVWEAAGVPHATPSCVMRYTRGPERGERTYYSAEAALSDAIDAIESNELHPEAILVDGARLMDTAAILHAWQERHNPA